MTRRPFIPRNQTRNDLNWRERKPRAKANMMLPVFIAAIILAGLCVGLFALVLTPIW